MDWFDYLLYGLVGTMTIWIVKRRFHRKEANKTNGDHKLLSENSSLELENKTDITVFSEHGDEFDLKEESSYKFAESAVVFGKLVEDFDQSVTNVNEPVVRGNDDDDSTHEIDCSKEIEMSSENDAEMSVYINHHSSSDADDNDDDDESHEFRVSDLQLTGFFHDISTDPLSKSIEEIKEFSYNIDPVVDTGVCTTMKAIDSYFNEHTDFVVDYEMSTVDINGRHSVEMEDISTASENDSNITDDDKIINVLDTLNRENTCEFHGLSIEHPSKLSDLGENIDEVSDSQSMCSDYSAETWPSTIYRNSSLDDIQFVEDYSDDGSFFNTTTDSDIYNQGFIKLN